MIYLGADHDGYNLKEKIKKYLVKLGLDFDDLGADKLNPRDDYPDFAKRVAKKVAKSSGHRGIIICDTGLGSCVAANKVKGVRAVFAWSPSAVKQAREDLDANVLCLGGRTHSAKEAEKNIKVWLETKFSGKERHLRRIKKINEIEKRSHLAN